jgi:hypothetical protein
VGKNFTDLATSGRYEVGHLRASTQPEFSVEGLEFANKIRAESHSRYGEWRKC